MKSFESSQMDNHPLHTRVDARDIEEHTTLLLQSLRAYLGADEFRRALGPSAEDFFSLCSLRDDELRICVVVHHDQYDRVLGFLSGRPPRSGLFPFHLKTAFRLIFRAPIHFHT